MKPCATMAMKVPTIAIVMMPTPFLVIDIRIGRCIKHAFRLLTARYKANVPTPRHARSMPLQSDTSVKSKWLIEFSLLDGERLAAEHELHKAIGNCLLLGFCQPREHGER